MASGFHPIVCGFHQAINPRLPTIPLILLFSPLSPPTTLFLAEKCMLASGDFFFFFLFQIEIEGKAVYHSVRVLLMIANELYKTMPKTVDKLP